MKSNNSLLKGIAENTGSEITGIHSDNYYLKKIEENTKNSSGGSSSGSGGFSGNYNDLINKPTIPSDVADLTDLSDTAFTPKSHTHTKDEITDLGEYIPTSDIVDNLTTNDNSKVLSAKQGYALKNEVNSKAESAHSHIKAEITDFNHTHSESDIVNLGDYIEKSNTAGLVKNDGTIDTNTYLTTHQDITGKADKSDFDTLEVEVTYQDESTDTYELYVVPSS